MPATKTGELVKPVVSAFPRLLENFFDRFFIAVYATENAETVGPARRIVNLQSS